MSQERTSLSLRVSWERFATGGRHDVGKSRSREVFRRRGGTFPRRPSLTFSCLLKTFTSICKNFQKFRIGRKLLFPSPRVSTITGSIQWKKFSSSTHVNALGDCKRLENHLTFLCFVLFCFFCRASISHLQYPKVERSPNTFGSIQIPKVKSVRKDIKYKCT